MKQQLIISLLPLAGSLLFTTASASQETQRLVLSRIQQEYPSLFEIYKDLHLHPELSFQEKRSSAHVADELRKAGFDVTEHVGKYGVVALLRNGDGPTVLVRSDLDALPVKEQTGLPYASTAMGT